MMCNAERTRFFRPWHGEQGHEDEEEDKPKPEEDDRSSVASSSFSCGNYSSESDSRGGGGRRSCSVSSGGGCEDACKEWPQLAGPGCHHQLAPAAVWPIGPAAVAAAAAVAYHNSYVHEAVYRLNRHDAIVKQIKKSRPKKFACPVPDCKLAFSNNGQLNGHLRTHSGEKPFECTEDGCGKRFTRNEELTRHKRIHTNDRPYPCQICGKRFGRKDHLKKHTLTHNRSAYQFAAAAAAVASPFAGAAHGFPFAYYPHTAQPYIQLAAGYP